MAGLKAKATGSEEVAVIGRVAYLDTPDGFGTSRLAAAVERTLEVAATARNWNTVLKLQALAEERSWKLKREAEDRASRGGHHQSNGSDRLRRSGG